MSRRRSTGDLVPRDITEILAREARAQRGQKKSGSSLGHAFSWLKGSRKKKSITNGLRQTSVGVMDAKVGFQNHEPPKAGLRGTEDQKRLAVHYTTSQHYQENVFIEGSRPQHLEDLHTEAQEGLKILQQEEHKNGVNFPDDDSIASTDTLHPEQNVCSKDRGCSPELKSITGNTDTTTVSALSTRPVLTRQGSTFKPLNPVKKLDTTKRRSRRTTIMGIPSQVQKELALHRNFQQFVSTQYTNQEKPLTNSQSDVVIIPTVDGGTPLANKEGARVHLSELEASKDEQLLKRHLEEIYRQDCPFSQKSFGSHLHPLHLRPKSLAVPGMTTSSSLSPSMVLTFLQEQQGPVMSISPQATYLSTIIPNAVLPASVEVIEIDRSSSRTHGNSVNHGSSVRTVSKSSLASGDLSISPLLSRRSDGDGFQTDNSQDSQPASTSGSTWSKSQSSKTIVSNSSPVSSKANKHSGNLPKLCLNGQESWTVQTTGDQDLVSHPGSKSETDVPAQGSESGLSGVSLAPGEDAKTKLSVRGLSIMKTKQPPAPPRRTNSLHDKKIRSYNKTLVDSTNLNGSVSREETNATEDNVANKKIKSVAEQHSMISSVVPKSDRSSSVDASSSATSLTQASSNEGGGGATESNRSSPQKTPSEGKFERTISPSSGYSSQSGTPTLSPKGISPTSPEKPKKKPVKPGRCASRASSSAASPSSSLTSLSSSTSEPVNLDTSRCSPILPPPTAAPTELIMNNISPTLTEVKELLNIPPPPNVKAPCPPPPETWVHNRRCFELLCGPRPNVNKAPQKTAQKDCPVKQAGTQTEDPEEMQAIVKKQSDKSVSSELTESKAYSETSAATEPKGFHKEWEIKDQEQRSTPAVKEPDSQEKGPKKDPPPVMKKPSISLRELMSTEHTGDRQEKEMRRGVATDVNLPAESHSTSSQGGIRVNKSHNEMDKNKAASTQVLSEQVPQICKVSPPHTPPPAHQPTPPLSRKTPPPSVSAPPEESQMAQEDYHTVDSCWPPPPPPMEGDSVFDGGDEVDFPPPPPPPFVTVSASSLVDNCVTELDNSNGPVDREETLQDSSDAETTLPGHVPDLPPVLPEIVADTKSEDDVPVSEINAGDDISSRPVPGSNSIPPPPVEAPNSIPIARLENPASASDLTPPISILKMEDHIPSEPPVNTQPSVAPPVAPPLPAENLTHGVTFRRQPSLTNRDARSKELHSRHKSVPSPKEDANIPLVTPSLLQMVRLRSVSMVEDQVQVASEEKSINQEVAGPENCPVSVQGPQTTPQKPIRKSLSLKSPPQSVKTSSVTLNAPSMRLQEAIRMKTAAMSSREGLPSRVGVRSSTHSHVGEQGALSLKSAEGCDLHKSPASTASFIFSRSTKKVVIETAAASTPEGQASLKQSLAAELMHVSDQSKAVTLSNGGLKSDKVPPPVAKKPSHGGISPLSNRPACSAKQDYSVDENGAIRGEQHMSGITSPETATTRVTADTIETLF